MTQFQQYSNVQRLRQFCENPIDLTKEGVLSKERLEKMKTESCGFKLLYATERVNDDVMQALFDLGAEAHVLKKMHDMQSGEVINKIEGYESENRMVLHTAMRDFFEDQNQAKAAREASKLAWDEIEKLRSFMKEIDKKDFTDLVQIGIGGSDLGPRALTIACHAFHKEHRRGHFISNVDPDDATQVINDVDLSKTLFVVVSKSGSTLETLTNEELVRERLRNAGLNPKDHFIAVTGKGSPMDDPSRYRTSFYIWDYIGGRYSVTSMVGGVMLSFVLGVDGFLEILKGASKMDKIALSKDMKVNLPLVNALLGIWNRNFLHLPTVAIIPYSQALLRFPAHLQQLDMESNGKHIEKKGGTVDFETGPIIWGEPGTNGQHSFYQLIHQGTTVVPVELIGFKESQYSKDLEIQDTTSQEKLLSNLLAQSVALAIGQKSDNPNKCFSGNRPNHLLLGACLTPETVGSLLSYFENKVAFQGFIWNINSFDQEGVQLGKVLANKFIELFKAKKHKQKSDFELGKNYLEFLEDLNGF